MNKKLLTSLLCAVALSGCASQANIGNQLEELKALDAYHDAQRRQDKAGQAVVASTAALAASVLKKAEADKETKAAKENLEAILAK